MPRLVYWNEKHGQGVTIELDSKETVVCSIAQMGVLVFLYNTKSLIGGILSNFWARGSISKATCTKMRERCTD
jgi:hypothetical protein